jgi:DNA (cytosine-5)-methyltransferase 1
MNKPAIETEPGLTAGRAVRSSPWLDSDCNEAAASGDAVASQRRHGRDDTPKLLDLFCCAGGAGEGYRLAGFDVTGVDIAPQPKNPHRFVQADALEYLAEHHEEYDAIHASPPCQAYTKAGKQWRKEGREYPDVIASTRAALMKCGKLWVIENVPGAPLRNPVLLNGSMFGMRVHRPRLFEASFPLDFRLEPVQKPVKMGRAIRQGDVVQPVGHFAGVEYAAKEMGLPWMGQAELSQAIPPAYTKWIGEQILKFIPLVASEPTTLAAQVRGSRRTTAQESNVRTHLPRE